MSKKKKAKRTLPITVQKVVKEKPLDKSITLIFGGVFVAISSIGLLIFVLSKKILN